MSRPTTATRCGELAFEHCDVRLPLQVLRSNAGHYLGTADDDGPVSRESAEYWPTEQEARIALATSEWTQRDHP